MGGISEDQGRRETVWFVCGRAPKVNTIRRRRVDLQHIGPINVSTQSRCQGGQGVEKTTPCNSYGSAPNSGPEFTVKDRRLYDSSAYNMHERMPTHGSSGECSISTKVEVKAHREVNNRNPRINLGPRS